MHAVFTRSDVRLRTTVMNRAVVERAAVTDIGAKLIGGRKRTRRRRGAPDNKNSKQNQQDCTHLKAPPVLGREGLREDVLIAAARIHPSGMCDAVTAEGEARVVADERSLELHVRIRGAIAEPVLGPAVA